MFKKILVPTDGSELSNKAVQAAIGFARDTGATIIGLTVVDPYPYSGLAEYRPESYNDYHNRMLKEAETRLETLAKNAKAAEVAVETVTQENAQPWEGIIRTAQEKGCDLIVMASHGRRGVQALLLGSETQKVLTQSKIPVLVYR